MGTWTRERRLGVGLGGWLVDKNNQLSEVTASNMWLAVELEPPTAAAQEVLHLLLPSCC